MAHQSVDVFGACMGRGSMYGPNDRAPSQHEGGGGGGRGGRKEPTHLGTLFIELFELLAP